MTADNAPSSRQYVVARSDFELQPFQAVHSSPWIMELIG
jgi:hypothetical protein